MQLGAEFACFLLIGAMLGIWHAQMGTKAVFTFRNDEPYSSWVTVIFGPLSTLPAVAVALFARRWSARWLVAGGLVSLGAIAVGATTRGHKAGEIAEHVLFFLIMVSGPMIALGSGLVWIQRRYKGQDMLRIPGRRSRLIELALLSSYVLLSLGAFVVADFPFFSVVLETRWVWVVTLLLGPFMMLAMGRFIGMPVYLAETVVVLGLLWLAITQEKRRKAALWGALIAWIASGLFFLAIIFAYD